MPPASGGRSRPPIPWRRRRGRSRSSAEATRSTRRSPPPSRSPSATRTTAAWAATCSRWSSGPTAATIALNASGRAPAGVDPDALRAEYGTALPEHGPTPITVPGAVSGWATLHAEGATAAVERGVRRRDRARHRRRRRLAIALAARSRNASRCSPPTPASRTCSSQEARRSPAARSSGSRRSARRCRTLAPTGRGRSTAARSASGTRAGLRAAGSPMTLEDLAAHTADVVAAARRPVPRCRRPGRAAEQPGVRAPGDARARRAPGDRPRSARPGRRTAGAGLRGGEPRSRSAPRRRGRDARPSLDAAGRRAPGRPRRRDPGRVLVPRGEPGTATGPATRSRS